jgi:hypothetical protein
MQEERPDAYAYRIFLSQTMVDIILEDGKVYTIVMLQWLTFIAATCPNTYS